MNIFLTSLGLLLFACGQLNAESDAHSITPFKIEIGDDVLQDLHGRLKQARIPEMFANDWSYGTNGQYLKELIDYWLHSYNWTVQQDRLNKLPQYKITIEGLSLHFIHAQAPKQKDKPLVERNVILFSHGWPGSMIECANIVPYLIENDDVVFDVVCPTIPGYPFSEAPSKPGYNIKKVAEMYVQLMARLGYKNYIAQGGDWGSIISTYVASIDPDHCKGVHINMFALGTPKGFIGGVKTLLTLIAPSWFLSESEIKHFKDFFYNYIFDGIGYFVIQATKPDTISPALNDSPMGLACYLVEKFKSWTDKMEKISKDDLLTNIMIYWATQSIAPSIRFYYENYHPLRLDDLANMYVQQPTGYALFPKEAIKVPSSWVEYYYNLVSFTEMPRGGHFAALEEPQLLADDIRKFYGLMNQHLSQKKEL